MTADSLKLGRRSFLRSGTLVLTSAATMGPSLFAAETIEPLKFGLVTDLHYADKPAKGTRHYRQTLGKFQEAATQIQKEQPEFVVELGDFIDAADSVETEQRYLNAINREFAAVCEDRHYVLGNHCVDTLHKQEFLGAVEQERSYYSFDRGSFHFVVLDSCFRSDGQPYGRKNFKWTDANIPDSEIEWLTSDLEATDKHVIVFAHQRLDVSKNHAVKNSAVIRKVLERSGKVLAVFQGHSHKNELQDIGGIHYCTLVAMVEGSGVDNNGYSILSARPDGTILLEGYRRQKDYRLGEQG